MVLETQNVLVNVTQLSKLDERILESSSDGDGVTQHSRVLAELCLSKQTQDSFDYVKNDKNFSKMLPVA